MNPDYQKICLQLQLQRNSFADAHATAAARGDQLAEEVERLKAALDTNSETIIKLRQEVLAMIAEKNERDTPPVEDKMWRVPEYYGDDVNEAPADPNIRFI